MEFHRIAGVAQLVERQPSKLNVAGSNPVSRSKGLGKVFIVKIKKQAKNLKQVTWNSFLPT